MTGEELLAGLSDPQRHAATTLDGALLIKAGPGSGKTRTITHRIAYGVATGAYDPGRTLAVTFTTRASGELRHRLASLGAGAVVVRTFHAAALRQLRHFWPDAVGGSPQPVVADRQQLIRVAAGQAGFATDADTLSALTGELDFSKARQLTADSYLAGATADRVLPGDPEAIARFLAGYEAAKSGQGVIDFDDVLLVTVGILESRTDLRETVRRAFRWITVDEYQDVSPLQQRLLDLWLSPRPQLCAVGDPAQTIYQFAGADPALLATFPTRYAGAGVVDLAETYRCPPQVVTAANRLATGIPGAVRLRATSTGGSVQLLRYPSDRAEAEGVAAEIAALLSAGGNPGGIACLVRTNAQIAAVRAELVRRGVPTAVRGGDRFHDRPEVKEALVRLRAERRVAPDAPAGTVLAAVLDAMGHTAAIPDTGPARDRWESLAALTAWPLVTAATDGADLVTRLTDAAAAGHAPPPAGVSLLTIHAAKGLEWDTVFVVGASDGLLPLARAAGAEELRLAYVAVTRAARRLVLTWAGRGPAGETRRPSPYLAAFGRARQRADGVDAPAPLPFGPEPVAATPRQRPPARCRVCGQALVTGAERTLGRCRRCPGPEAADLLAALTRWRDAVAADDGVPGHLIVTDTVLLAVAEQRPATAAALAAIPGLRPDKLDRFAAHLLAVVAQSANPGTQRSASARTAT